MHALTRALTAVLVVLAVAAPAASARAVDPPTNTPAQRAQDLRHLAAGARPETPTGVFHAPTAAPTAPTAPKGVYWSYEYEAQAPTPAVQAPGRAAPSDDGMPWMTIGLIVAGASLLIGGALVLTMRRRPRTAHAV
jgi:hypothetical protein